MSVLEVERKFTVDPGFAVPAFTAPDTPTEGWVSRSGVPVKLDATYYDTEDLRLAAAHLTLRRRTGGKDPGWHLKLPAGGEREEIQRPLGRGKAVLEELADLVLARTRGAALAPVARIRTTRTVTTIDADDGTPLVEVADDQVVGERLGEVLQVSRWREVEAELLTAGHDDALSAVVAILRRAGATPSPSASKLAQTLAGPDAPDHTVAPDAPGTPDSAVAPDAAGAPDAAVPAVPAVAIDPASAGGVLAAYLTEQVEALEAVDPRVRRELDDAVHAMRVASRRLRSALHTFRPLLDRAALGDLDAELAWLAAVLGEVRDREVLHERFQALLDALPPELVLGPVRNRLLDTELRAGQLRAHTETLEALRSRRYLTLLDRLDTLAAAPPLLPAAAGPAVTVLPGLARRAWKRLDQRATRALRSGDDQHLHDTRKAAKQARYAAEALTPTLGKPAARLGELAKRIQTVLGDHQDAVVARTLLRQLAVTQKQSFTYGLLYAAEQRRAEASAGEFARDWAAADGATGRRLLAKLDRRSG